MVEGSRGEMFRCGGALTGLRQLTKGVFPLVLFAFPAHGATCHVSPSGDNLNDGSANRIAGLFTRGLLDQQASVNHNLYFPAIGASAVRDIRDESKAYASVTEIRDDKDAEDEGIDGDALFVDPECGDFRLTSASPAVDAGGFLTHAVGEGRGCQIKVQDAGYFIFPGFSGMVGDRIVAATQPPVRVTALDRTYNVLTVDTPMTWTDAMPVILPYTGKAPDIGSFEFSTGGDLVEGMKR